MPQGPLIGYKTIKSGSGSGLSKTRPNGWRRVRAPGRPVCVDRAPILAWRGPRTLQAHVRQFIGCCRYALKAILSCFDCVHTTIPSRVSSPITFSRRKWRSSSRLCCVGILRCSRSSYPSCKDFMWMPARRKLAAGYCKISGSPEIYLEDSCWHHDGLETVTFLSHCNAHIGAS